MGPEQGHRFNPKLLIDPYAKAIEGPVRWELANTLPYVPARRTPTSSATTRTTSKAIPKGIVIDEAFDWGDRPLRTPWHDTVIYEVHVKGFTKAARERPRRSARHLRGPRLGASIEYLTSLGVTAVELLPVHHIADEQALADKELTNYWGYSSIGYLAPHAATPRPARRATRCASSRGSSRRCTAPDRGDPRRRLQPHAEGNHLGPMLSFKGIDSSYYRTVPGDARPTWTTRARATRSTPCTRRCCA